MNYFEAFEKAKKALSKLTVPDKSGPFAIQVRLSDEDACGTFYILISDGKITPEPYDYFDNDADIYTSLKSLLDLISGKLDIKKAVSENIISVSGDIDTLSTFFKKPAVKRTAAKKAAPAKKTTSKTIKKETEESKMADDKNKPQKEDVIKEVVEKETKPKK